MVYTPSKPIIESANSVKKTEHLLKKQFPKRHEHYILEDFFCFNQNQGDIVDWNDARNILVTEDFIIGLVEGLDQEVGLAASTVMYNIGRKWGLKDAEFFKQWFEKEYEYERGINHYPTPYVLEAWWWPFTSQGWGNWSVDLAQQKNGFIFVNIFDSAVARTLGNVGKPVCHIYAGLLAGFFTGLTKKELDCIEINCYALGETYCKFLIGKKDRIDAANFWMSEGASARDIETRLHGGEYLK